MAIPSTEIDKVRRMLGNPTDTEISDEDIGAFYSQALIEYAYANQKTVTIDDIEADTAYDLSSIDDDIIDITVIVDTEDDQPLDDDDYTFDSSAQTLTVDDTSGEIKLTYVKSYNYGDVPTIDKIYVEYLCISFCLEQIAAIRDRLPIVSSFKLVTGKDILNESSRYLEKWQLRFRRSEVY